MFDQIFGNYLVSSGYLSQEQFEETLAAEEQVRVKLGLIAVTEKLMTQEQAEEVNELQAVMDKRFGDIAVEKGYLSDEQVGRLLKKQGNIYMVFVQALIDKGYMTLEEIDEMLSRYQAAEQLSGNDMDDLVSGDIDRTIAQFLPENNPLGQKHCGIAIRTLLRLIDSRAYISKAYLVDELNADNFTMQPMKGDHSMFVGFAGAGKGLLQIAVPFAKEEFEAVDLDALDAVGEFINCINGLFASEQSANNVDVDMMPPEFFEAPCVIRGSQFIVLPIHFKRDVINFVLAIDSDLKIENK